MADQVTYAQPIESKPGTLTLEPRRMVFDLLTGTIEVTFVGENSVTVIARWTDADDENATGKIVALNTANLTSNSLRKRLITQAVTDGKIPSGTVT